MLRDGAPELAAFAAWVLQDRHGPGALALAPRAFRRTDDIGDASLRGQTRWSILSVLHPAIVEQLRSAVMIDIEQLPKNPALERWVASEALPGALAEPCGPGVRIDGCFVDRSGSVPGCGLPRWISCPPSRASRRARRLRSG